MVVDGYMEFQVIALVSRTFTARSDLGKDPMPGDAQVVTHSKRAGIEDGIASAAPFEMFK